MGLFFEGFEEMGMRAELNVVAIEPRGRGAQAQHGAKRKPAQQREREKRVIVMKMVTGVTGWLGKAVWVLHGREVFVKM